MNDFLIFYCPFIFLIISIYAAFVFCAKGTKMADVPGNSSVGKSGKSKNAPMRRGK